MLHLEWRSCCSAIYNTTRCPLIVSIGLYLCPCFAWAVGLCQACMVRFWVYLYSQLCCTTDLSLNQISFQCKDPPCFTPWHSTLSPQTKMSSSVQTPLCHCLYVRLSSCKLNLNPKMCAWLCVYTHLHYLVIVQVSVTVTTNLGSLSNLPCSIGPQQQLIATQNNSHTYHVHIGHPAISAMTSSWMDSSGFNTHIAGSTVFAYPEIASVCSWTKKLTGTSPIIMTV